MNSSERYTGSANLYTYALNNPLTKHDPYGLLVHPYPFQPGPKQIPTGFDPNRWKEVGAALGHASLAYTRDTVFGSAKYVGGCYGPEDMSFMEIYDATNTARNQLFQASENWMQSSPYAGTELYDFVRSSAYMGIDFAAAYLLPGMKLKAGVSAGVSAGKAIYRAEKTAFASPTLLKTNQVFGKLFKSNVAKSSHGGWVLPEKGGGAMIRGRWYVEHALERMAPRTPQVMAKLEARALKRASARGLQPGTEEFGRWMSRNGPNPRGIPPSIVEAEIANPGSTNIRVILNQQGNVITVIPRGK